MMGQGDHYDADVKELAYQLYAFEADGSFRRVQALLAAGYHEYDAVEVPIRTLQDWGVRYGWSERALREVASLMPALYGQAVSAYVVGRVEAARVIRAIMNDERTDPAIVQANKVRLAAAVAMADRSGDSPLGRTAEKSLAVELADARVDVQALPAEGLRGVEDDLLDRIKEDRAKQAQAERLRR